MKGWRIFWALMLVGAVVWLPPRRAHAGAYQCTVVQLKPPAAGATTTLTKKPGADKIAFAPSTKKGDGGVTVQLNAKDISCGSKCSNNVVQLGVVALGAAVPDAAGILFDVTGGQALFKNGKNKTATGPLFGSLASIIFGNSLGIGAVMLHEPASDPTACSVVPLPAGNHCDDGAVYAIAGFIVPVDTSLTCTSDEQCGLTQECSTTTHFCVIQTCAGDTDCRSGQCNINSGQCCQDGVGAGSPLIAFPNREGHRGPRTHRGPFFRSTGNKRAVTYSGGGNT